MNRTQFSAETNVNAVLSSGSLRMDGGSKIEANVSDATAAQMAVFTGASAPVRNKSVNVTLNGKTYEVRVDGEGRVVVKASAPVKIPAK